MSCGCENGSNLPNGIDGFNAYTVTTASYTQPAVNTNVTISVSNSGQYTGKWAVPNQTIFVENGGYYIVVSSTATSITMKYESDYATYNQSLTAAAGTVATNKRVSPAGKKGGDGTNGTSGTTILYAYNDTTGTGNSNATGEDTLGTYTVLANELDVNGDQLDIDAYYTYSSPNEVVMRVKFGGTVFTYTEQASLSTRNSLHVRISRISATSQMIVMTRLAANSTKIYYNTIVDQAAGTATLSNANAFQITADNIIAGANQVVLNQLVIKKLNA